MSEVRVKLGLAIRTDLVRRCKQHALDRETKQYLVIEEALEVYFLICEECKDNVAPQDMHQVVKEALRKLLAE